MPSASGGCAIGDSAASATSTTARRTRLAHPGAVIEGLHVLEKRGLVFEVVGVYPLHLGHVPALARARPDLRIVVDHPAKPPIASGDLAAWKRDLATTASHPNVSAKISGLNTAADWATWSADDLVESISHAIEVFGADRLMIGSDWPVAILAGDYQRVWSETVRAMDLLAIRGSDRDALLGGTAAPTYRIGGAT